MRTLVAIALALTARMAQADDAPITVQLGVGVSMMRWKSDYATYDSGDDALRAALALRADFGYRVHPNVSLGVHAGISTSAAATHFAFNPPDFDAFPIRYTPLEIGLGATFTHARLWFAPWYGVVDVQESGAGSIENQPRIDAFGFDAGYDVAIDPAGHRFGVIASLSHGGDWTRDGSSHGGFTSLTVGAAYRFW